MSVSFFPPSYFSATASNYVRNAAVQVILAKMTGISATKAVVIASLVADIAFSVFMATSFYYLGFGALGIGVSHEVFVAVVIGAHIAKFYFGQKVAELMNPHFNYFHLFSRHVILLLAAQLSTCQISY